MHLIFRNLQYLWAILGEKYSWRERMCPGRESWGMPAGKGSMDGRRGARWMVDRGNVASGHYCIVTKASEWLSSRKVSG